MKSIRSHALFVFFFSTFSMLAHSHHPDIPTDSMLDSSFRFHQLPKALNIKTEDDRIKPFIKQIFQGENGEPFYSIANPTDGQQVEVSESTLKHFFPSIEVDINADLKPQLQSTPTSPGAKIVLNEAEKSPLIFTINIEKMNAKTPPVALKIAAFFLGEKAKEELLHKAWQHSAHSFAELWWHYHWQQGTTARTKNYVSGVSSALAIRTAGYALPLLMTAFFPEQFFPTAAVTAMHWAPACHMALSTGRWFITDKAQERQEQGASALMHAPFAAIRSVGGLFF